MARFDNRPSGGRGGYSGENVMTLDDGRLATLNQVPGVRVYDEDLLRIGGNEWRTWNPTRSKLGAYLVKGGKTFPVGRASRVLYLGAANGTTVSHVTDVNVDGATFAVEFSPRSFRDLARVAERRPNLVPFLADAGRPELYGRFVSDLDFLFQDISQRNQGQLFARNVVAFEPRFAMIAIKARSVDVAADPRDVYERVTREVEDLTGYRVEEALDLGPFERDHAAVLFSRKG